MDTPDTDGGESRPRLALIAGPTASGKSAIALALARAANGVIINADASQVYRDLSILSARPSAAELAQAPHRLYGHIDADDACTAARWASEARTQIDKVHAQGRLPILVGGTGLYIRTLIDGIAPVPDIDPDVRAAVRGMPVADAHAALAQEDPPAAARLAPADASRIARALEVIRSTGRALSEWQRHKAGGIADRVALRSLILLPPRAWLIDRCETRFVRMISEGAIEEVEALLRRNLSPDLPAMRAIGVPEIAAHLRGEIDRTTMIERAQISTRQYAKRQYTWFANQPPNAWPRFDCTIDDKNISEIVTKLQH